MTSQTTQKLYTMSPIVMGIIIGVYIVCVIITAGLGFGLTGDLAEVSRTSLWDCNDSEAVVFDNNTCAGLDFAQYNTTAIVTSPVVSKLHKTMLITLLFQRVGTWSTVLSTNVSVDVVITGKIGNESMDVVVDDRNWTMHVYCQNASNWCNAATLNHINALTCETYEVKMSIVGHGSMQANETRVPWIGDTVVVMETAHVTYTLTSIIWGSAVALVLILVMVLFALACVRVHGFNLHFRWILLLFGTCVLYNCPLEVLSVFAPGWFFELFEQLCMSTFIVLLCAYWLIVFRNANTKVKKQRFFEGDSKHQKIMKLVLLLVPILFATTITTWQRVHDRDQYDLLHLFGYEVLCALVIVMMCFYTGFSMYALFRVDAEYDPDFMTAGNHRRRMIFYVLSFAVLLTTMLDFVVVMLVPSFLDHLGRDIFLSAVLSSYMVLLMIFTWPVAKHTHYKVSTKNNVITISETEDDGTDTQSVDISSAPHSSFSIDFNFARPEGIGPGGDRYIGIGSSSSTPSFKDTLPVPKDSKESESTTVSTMDSSTAAEGGGASESESDEDSVPDSDEIYSI